LIHSKMTWRLEPVTTAAKITAGLRNKALRIALNAAAAPAKQAVIDAAPSTLGLLRRSIKIKIKHYRKGDAWAAVIGAISSFKRARKTRDPKTGRSKIARDKDGNKQWIQPARYQYPLDRGSKRNSAREFMARAFRSSSQQFQRIAFAKLREQFEQLALQAGR
jgi:hypothetical protein